MIRQTGAVAAYLDKKALSRADAAHLQKILAGTGLPVLTEGEITGLGDLSWETYTAVLATAEEISPGGRVHTGTLSGSGEPVAVRIPAALVAEADRADQKAFREALALVPAASVTGKCGEILPLFITFVNHRDEIIHYLISLCIRIIGDRWNTATEGDQLVVTKTRFDPAKAGPLGVPKGPLFGRLSNGQSVEVGGVVITPAMVSSCSETRIHIPGLERYINEVHS
jgi:D-aminoacyl-tRNA deacylase